ncbi:MAG: EF-hand domain-containing protein [Sphingomicrobium sp.]
MPLPLLIALILAQAPATIAPSERAIVVTGHAWAPFISPMGEPFRAHSVTDNTLANWFAQADSNRDGALTMLEMRADAERFFVTLDTGGDGAVDPDELIHYEWEIAPDVQIMSKTRRPAGAAPPPPEDSGGRKDRERDDNQDFAGQGAARYSLLNMPQPVAAADINFDRSITAAEFRAAAGDRFLLLDRGHTGRLTLPELELQLAAAQGASHKRNKRKHEPDTRLGNPLPSGG